MIFDNYYLLLGLAGLLGFVIRGFFSSYVAEKGKNAATKEDIEEITGKVESIKSQLNEQSSFRQTRRERQAEALLAFHDAAVEILHEHYSVNFGDFPLDDGAALYKFQTSFAEGAVKLVKCHRRLSVFLQDRYEILQSADAVVAASGKVQTVFKERFPAVKRAMMEEGHAYRSVGNDTQYRLAVEASDVANDQFWRAIKPHASEFDSAFAGFVGHLASFVTAPA